MFRPSETTARLKREAASVDDEPLSDLDADQAVPDAADACETDSSSTHPAGPTGNGPLAPVMADASMRLLQRCAEELFDLLRRARQAQSRGEGAAARKLDLDAARLMSSGVLARWLHGYFKRRGAAQPEDLVQDVWLTLIKGQYEVHSNAFALVCRVAMSRLQDARRRAMRDVAEFDDPQDCESMLSSLAMTDADPVLVDCVRRRFAAMLREHPARAELLEMVAFGLSYAEIGAAIFQKLVDDIDTKDVARVRDRIYQARLTAARYFQECR